jgi:hypothetical protein
MEHQKDGIHFSIVNGYLYAKTKNLGTRRVTHIRRVDGGGLDYMKVWASGIKVLAGFSKNSPFLSLTLTTEGRLEGARPSGYQYDWVVSAITID